MRAGIAGVAAVGFLANAAIAAAVKLSPAEIQAAFFTGQSFTASTPSNVTVLPASPKATSAASVKNAKRDDARELLDQVPSGLRKRFGF